MRIMVVYAL